MKKDTLLANGQFVKEERIANNNDLDINEDNKPIDLDNEPIDDRDIGKDFFQMEERQL